MDVEQLVRELIDETIHMSLGTSANNKPWVCEVHFAYDHELNLYWRSLTSRRHSQEIAQNPNVSGTIVHQHGLDEVPRGLYFEGVAELLETGADQTKAYETIRGRLHVKDGILEEAQNSEGHQFYKITVNTFYIFGVFEGKGQKLELQWSDRAGTETT